MSTRSPTTTSYAILGLLAIRPWATYDLAKLMRRSLHFFWPRAESNLFKERRSDSSTRVSRMPAKEWNGDRKRTVYSITDRGREALREWLATPPAPARVESEAQLRLLYANYGSKDDLLATIQSIEDDAQSDDRPLRPAREPSTHAETGSSPIASTSTRSSRRSRSSRRAPPSVGHNGHAAPSKRGRRPRQPDVEWAVKTMLHAAREPQDD